MDRYDELFVPEIVDEQIDQLSQNQPGAEPADSAFIQELQHLEQQDVRRLAEIRQRLTIYEASRAASSNPVQHVQKTGRLLLPWDASHAHKRRRSQRLTALVSGLVALLVIGSMLTIAALGRTSSQQPLSQATPRTLTPSPGTTTPTSSSTPLVNGAAAFLMDADNGRVLVNVNSQTRLPITSTTKIMTAILAIEHLGLDDQIIVQQSELDEVPSGGYTLAGLIANDQLSVQSLLYGLLLPSGCDAAIVLAHAVSGNSASFVALMNAKAQELHLTNTHFANPAGFSDPNNYSTAADLTALARYAMSNSTFASIVGQSSYTVPATLYRHLYIWQTTNPLLRMYPGTDGIQMEASNQEGYGMVFSATRNGHHLIGAELQAPKPEALFSDVENLLNRGFTADH